MVCWFDGIVEPATSRCVIATVDILNVDEGAMLPAIAIELEEPDRLVFLALDIKLLQCLSYRQIRGCTGVYTEHMAKRKPRESSIARVYYLGKWFVKNSVCGFQYNTVYCMLSSVYSLKTRIAIV